MHATDNRYFLLSLLLRRTKKTTGNVCNVFDGHSFGEKLNQRKDVQWRQNVSLSNVHYYLLSVSPLSNRTMTESEYEMSRKSKKYYEIWFAYFSSFEISTTASFFSIINEETIRVSVMLSSRERGNIRFFSFIRISKVMHLFEKVKNNEGRLI